MGRIWPLVFLGMVGTSLLVSHAHLETWTGVFGIIVLYYSLIALHWRSVNYQGTYLKTYRPWMFYALGGLGWGLAIVSLGIPGILLLPLLLLLRWWRSGSGPGLAAIFGMLYWAILPVGGLWLWWVLGLKMNVPKVLWEAQWIWENDPVWPAPVYLLLPVSFAPFLLLWIRGLLPVQNPGLSGAQTDLLQWMTSLELSLAILFVLLPGYLLPFWILFTWSATHRVARVLHHLEGGALGYHKAYRILGLTGSTGLVTIAVYAAIMGWHPSWTWWPIWQLPGVQANEWVWIAAVATSAVAGYTLRARLWKQKLWETGVWVSALLGVILSGMLVILLQEIN
jgi:hypothetical protein